MPNWLKRPIRNLADGAQYHAVRMASVLARPALGKRAPLRGYEIDIANHAKRTGCPYLASSTANIGVAILPLARVLFDYGVVVTSEHMLLGDISPTLGGRPRAHPVLRMLRLPEVTHFSGRLAVLSSSAHQRYFHWMFDVLPRIDLLREMGLSADAYLVNTELGFQRETVETLGIAPTIAPTLMGHVEADELIVPTLPTAYGYPSLRSCDFLRKSFLPTSPLARRPRRLYVTRRDAETRRIDNEQELLTALSPMGFECVELQGMTVREQAMLFASAEMVVAPHGAGLANLAFCPSGSGVLEFMPDCYNHRCSKMIASFRNMRYREIQCTTTSPLTQNMVVEVAGAVEAIKSMTTPTRMRLH